MGALGFHKRPGELAELQACATVGQSRLMAIYDKLFGAHGLAVIPGILNLPKAHALLMAFAQGNYQVARPG